MNLKMSTSIFNSHEELVRMDYDSAISESNFSEHGQTEEEDDLPVVVKRDYSEIKAEIALSKRLDYLLRQVETFFGTNAEEPTLLSDFTIPQFDETPSYIENGTLRDFQLQGLNWLISLYEKEMNGILADEMGLGKTIQTIAFLGYLKHCRKDKGKHLVIVPVSTLANWKNEFEKWCPSIRVLFYYADKYMRKLEREKLQKKLKSRRWDVCLTTIDRMYIERHALQKLKWCYLVIDEGSRIKNESNVISKIVRKLQSTHRLLLTGTPLQNNLHELWSLLNFLVPNIFNSSEDFDTWFNTKTCLESTTTVQRLHTILKPFLLRRLKCDVEESLPPKKIINIFISLTKLEKERYAQILSRETDGGYALGSTNSSGFALLSNLRKCCNHPYLFDGFEPGPPFKTDRHLVYNSGKMVILDKLLDFLRDQGSRVLIFSQFTRMLDILEDYAQWRKFPFCRLDGKTLYKDRKQQIYNFNKPDSKKFIFLLATRAGGLGINLNTADIVIFYDMDYNPHWDLQAMDRAHRIGQKKTVRVFRLIAENTMEEKMLEIAETKLRLENIVIEKGRKMNFYTSEIREKEVPEIIRHGADNILVSKDAEIADEDIEIIIEKNERKTQEKQAKLESKVASTLRNFPFPSSEDYQECQKAGIDQLIELPKRNHSADSDIGTHCINLLFESIKDSNSFPSDAPEDYHEYHEDARIDNIIQLPKRKRMSTSDGDFNSLNLHVESIDDNSSKSFSSTPEDYQEYHEISSRQTDRIKEKSQFSMSVQNSENKSVSSKNFLEPIEISGTVSKSTNNGKNPKSFSTLSSICIDHLKKVVRTAIQFQRHSHSRRLSSKHFSKALMAHGYNFESDYSVDFLDFCTSRKQR